LDKRFVIGVEKREIGPSGGNKRTTKKETVWTQRRKELTSIHKLKAIKWGRRRGSGKRRGPNWGKKRR